ncbi:TetR/AcrR family transcriptional regulator [Streptomyces capparidis]
MDTTETTETAGTTAPTAPTGTAATMATTGAAGPEARRRDAAAGDAALGTRERIVRAAARLLQRQGYEGTGIKQIAREAGATLGSVYHFFPGGKQELAVEAIRHGDEDFAALLREVMEGDDDPARALITCTRLLAEGLRESGWTDGCPVTATALEPVGRVPEVQQAVARTYRNWQDVVHRGLRAAGFPEEAARELACTVIVTIDGAEVAAQVARSEEPLLLAGRHLARLIDSYR